MTTTLLPFCRRRPRPRLHFTMEATQALRKVSLVRPLAAEPSLALFLPRLLLLLWGEITATMLRMAVIRAVVAVAAAAVALAAEAAAAASCQAVFCRGAA